MPRLDMDEQFGKPPSEWTRRKHSLVGRYVVPAAMKMKEITRRSSGIGRIALVDGYAGPNKYADEVCGSTKIMVDAAMRVRETSALATVYACEHDPEHPHRYEQLRENLAHAVSDGVLITYPKFHADVTTEIRTAIGTTPALVFLDPQTAAQLTLDGDIAPWAKRPRTDVLGVFMGGQACRVCGQALNASKEAKANAAAFMGEHWSEATTDDEAYRVFFDELRGLKRFSALYRLRKQEPKTDAYGIFGLSDSPDGFWLLSDAVAKDWGALMDFDASKVDTHLFSEVDREDDETETFEELVELVRPIVKANDRLRGAKLAIEMFRLGRGVEEAFGRYTESNFTDAARNVLGLPPRKKTNA